ncbi:phage tail tip lysozyme [Labrys okinawensis]|nr:phage tail tip lysozyme [Labrys okinawensis]
MPAEATGFTAGFAKTGAKADAAFLGSISTGNRERVAADLQIFNDGLMNEASQFEYKGRGTYETNAITAAYQASLVGIRSNPSRRDQALAALNAKIDGATSIPAADRARLKRDIAAGSSIEWAKGMAGSDPDRMHELVWGAKTTIPKGAIGPAQADRESAAMSYFIGRGYSREQAAGIVGNLVHESAGLAPSSRNPGDGSDGSDSVGIAQWNGTRAKSLKAFAADRGKDWRDLSVQLAFVDHELNTDYAGVKARLRATNTADEAAGVFVTDYERPAGSQGGAAASHGWDNRRNQARRLAAGDYKPGEVEEKAPDPVVTSLAPDQRDGLVAYARGQRSQGQAVAQGDLEPRIQDATQALTTIGRYDGQLPTQAEFTASYGPQDGARRYSDFQRTVSLGADISAIRAMTPAEQTVWLAARAPKGEGPAFETQRQLHERGIKAIALDQAFRRKDPNGYVRSLHPQIDRLWTDAGTSPERLRAALAATNAAMDRLGMPTEGRALLPKAMVDQALSAFGDRSKSLAERLVPLRAALSASADPGAQQAIFGQMVSAGLPPALEYAAIAYAKGNAPLAERFAAAALGTGGKATGGADDASFASPAAAANTPAGPAPMRSLSGPAIDLGTAAAQALGSSLTGDERTSRAETVRTRMIENAMRNNGRDRLAAIAQTDRDRASLEEDGWVPGMFVREPEGVAPVQVAQIAHASPTTATTSNLIGIANGQMGNGAQNMGTKSRFDTFPIGQDVISYLIENAPEMEMDFQTSVDTSRSARLDQKDIVDGARKLPPGVPKDMDFDTTSRGELGSEGNARAASAETGELLKILRKGQNKSHVLGMAPALRKQLAAMLHDAPPEVRKALSIVSGYRSPKRQKELWDQALIKYGSAAVARRWVAPPGKSQHGFGNAMDLSYDHSSAKNGARISAAGLIAKNWMHANARKYGLIFPLTNEPWHIELVGARTRKK